MAKLKRKFPNLSLEYTVTFRGRVRNYMAKVHEAKEYAEDITKQFPLEDAFIEVSLLDKCLTHTNIQRVGWIKLRRGKEIERQGILGEIQLLKEMGQ